MTLSRDRAPACSANVPFLPNPGRGYGGFQRGWCDRAGLLGCAGSRASLMAAMMAARMVGRLAGPLPVRLAAVSPLNVVSLCGGAPQSWPGRAGRSGLAADHREDRQPQRRRAGHGQHPLTPARHLGRRGRPAVGSKERGPMSEPITPRRGMRFLHAHQITPAPTAKCPAPEPCRVTRVTKTTRLLPQ